MSWLDNRTIEYLFTNGDEKIIIEGTASDIPEAPEGYTYAGFKPDKTCLMTRVQYVQNGRVAYRIDVGNGKQIHRSATRERYEHVIGNTGNDAFREAKRQGKPIDTTETVFEKKFGAAIKEVKAKKYAKATEGLKAVLKGDKK